NAGPIAKGSSGRSLRRVADAWGKARPHRRTEIKRHPGDLVLPLGKVVRHDPPAGHVAQTFERPERPAAVRGFGPPSRQVHWDVDGCHEPGIPRNSGDPGEHNRAKRSPALPQHTTKTP